MLALPSRSPPPPPPSQAAASARRVTCTAWTGAASPAATGAMAWMTAGTTQTKCRVTVSRLAGSRPALARA